MSDKQQSDQKSDPGTRRATPDVPEILDALAHPIRRRILRALLAGPTSASAIAQATGDEVADVAYHLIKVLGRRFGLVEFFYGIPRRGSMAKVYRLKHSAWLIDNATHPLPANLGYQLSATGFILLAVLAAEERDRVPDTQVASAWAAVGVEDGGTVELHAAREALAEEILPAVGDSNQQEGRKLAGKHSLIVGIAALPYSSALDGLREHPAPESSSDLPPELAA